MKSATKSTPENGDVTSSAEWNCFGRFRNCRGWFDTKQVLIHRVYVTT
jgi:hypothetical protein